MTPHQPQVSRKESTSSEPAKLEEEDDAVMEGDACSICLHRMEDRTVIPGCSHEFCFECLLVWTGQSRRCPLCNQAMGDYLIHNIRSRYDYRKHFLPPLKSSSPTPQREPHEVVRQARQRRRERRRNYPPDDLNEADRLERSIAHRRWIYQHDLYAKHVGSNPITKYRPYPTPSQFSASPDLMTRTTTFLRRELRVWEGLDVEFLTNLIISLMKSIDIRSEAAVKLLAEFLDMDALNVVGGKRLNAEHFAHEVYCYIRSPYKDLFVYDTIVQYDFLPGIQPPSEVTRRRRWNQRGDSRSQSPPAVSRESSHGEDFSQVTEPPPRSKRRLAPSDPRVETAEPVASTSLFTPEENSITPLQSAGDGYFPIFATRNARSTTPPIDGPSASVRNTLTDTEPNILVSENEEDPRSRANSFTKECVDPKGKGKVAQRDGPLPLIRNGFHKGDSGELGVHPPTIGPGPSSDGQPGSSSSGRQEVNAPKDRRSPIRRDLKSSIRSYLG